MPTLPQAIDYGARPSLETNRLDRPGTGSQAVAVAAVVAANEFSKVLEQTEAKEDALNYALARNEIQTADIQLQAELAEDRDWKTHDERYQNKLRAAVDAVYGRYDFDPRDRTLMDAEAKLITAKGRVSVGGNSRKLEISQGIASLDKGMIDAREAFILAPDMQRPEVMRGQIEAIDSALANGYISDEEAETRRQIMTTDFSRADLAAMGSDRRIEEIETSLGYRRGYDSNSEFADDIRAAADESGLSPMFIAAVAQQESSMNPKAISATGNIGMMQLGTLAAQDYGVTDRTNAGQSLTGGAKYLADLEERYDGDRAKALAAYNWGPGKLNKAIKQYGDDWLSYAPDETKDYVRKLMPHWEGTAKGARKMMIDQATGVGPMTREDILAGRGTGSSADFLHTDELARMLEADYANDKENRQREAAFAVKDTAFELFPEDHDARMKYIADNSSGSVRDKAESEADQENNRQIAAKARKADELFEQYADTIDEWAKTDTPLKISEIPAEDLRIMSAGQQRALKNAIEGAQFAPITQHVDPNDGGMSIEEWENLSDYGPGGKVEQNLDSRLWRDALNREAWYGLDAQQKQLKALEHASVATPDVGPYVDRTLEAIRYNGVSDATERKAINARLETKLRDAVIHAQANMKPPRKLNTMEINGLLAEIMQQKAFIDDWGSDDEYTIATATTKQLDKLYLPIAQAKLEEYPDTTETGGQPISTYDYLKQKSKDITGSDKPADDEAIEKAYFALVNGLGTVEVERRLRGD